MTDRKFSNAPTTLTRPKFELRDWLRRLLYPQQALERTAASFGVPQANNPPDYANFNELPFDSGGDFEDSIPRGTCILVLDRSGSMASDNKLGAAKRGGSQFVREAAEQGYATGLIAFDTRATLLVEPTTDVRHFDAALAQVTSGGGTALAPAISLALEHFPWDATERAIVIFTDGETHDVEECAALANRARNEGVRIICRGTEDADHAFLRRLASDDSLVEVVDDSRIGTAIAGAARLLLPG